MGRNLFKRLEQQLERLLWRLRLIAILPVVMSLVSTAVTFVLGTMEIGRALLVLGQGNNHSKALLAELLISPIEAARDSDGGGNGLLDIRNLDQLKEKLVKVLVVALIVSAFKAMLSLPIRDGASLAFFCLSVLLLALSGYLVTGDGHKATWKS